MKLTIGNSDALRLQPGMRISLWSSIKLRWWWPMDWLRWLVRVGYGCANALIRRGYVENVPIAIMRQPNLDGDGDELFCILRECQEPKIKSAPAWCYDRPFWKPYRIALRARDYYTVTSVEHGPEGVLPTLNVEHKS